MWQIAIGFGVVFFVSLIVFLLVALKPPKKQAYRLGDAFFLTDEHGESARKSILDHHQGTLGHLYLQRAKHAGDFSALYQAMKSNFRPADTNEVVMHLRLGDAAALRQRQRGLRDEIKSKLPHPPKFLRDYVQKLSSDQQSKLVIITGNHNLKGQKETKSFVKSLGKGLKIIQHKNNPNDADRDVLRMIFAAEFIPSGGNFSNLVILMRQFIGKSSKHSHLRREPCVGTQINSNVICFPDHWAYSKKDLFLKK